jgi:hypothetical protein
LVIDWLRNGYELGLIWWQIGNKIGFESIT